MVLEELDRPAELARGSDLDLQALVERLGTNEPASPSPRCRQPAPRSPALLPQRPA